MTEDSLLKSLAQAIEGKRIRVRISFLESRGDLGESDDHSYATFEPPLFDLPSCADSIFVYEDGDPAKLLSEFSDSAAEDLIAVMRSVLAGDENGKDGLREIWSFDREAVESKANDSDWMTLLEPIKVVLKKTVTDPRPLLCSLDCSYKALALLRDHLIKQ